MARDVRFNIATPARKRDERFGLTHARVIRLVEVTEFDQKQSTTPTTTVSSTCAGEFLSPTLLRTTRLQNLHDRLLWKNV